MSTKLEQIEERLAEARTRSEETLRDLPDNRLLSRAEHDRQRLVKDLAALVAVVKAVQAIHEPYEGVKYMYCEGCEENSDGEYGTRYPCHTARVITRGLKEGPSGFAATPPTWSPIPRSRPMCDHTNDPGGREAAMVVLDPGTPERHGRDGVWCDPCLVPLVRALNDGGIRTVASCCGHGEAPSSVILDGDRWLLLVSRDEAQAFLDMNPTTEEPTT